MRTHFRSIGVLLVLSALLLPLPVNAQCVTEEDKPVKALSRKVVGTDGKPIAKVQVSVEDDKKNVLTTTLSNEEGLYKTDGLKPGTYRVLVRASGYIRYYYTLIVPDTKPRALSEVSKVRLLPLSECHDIVIFPYDDKK